MTTELNIETVCKLIARELGPKLAIAVYAAIEVAQNRWTNDDTLDYGTMAHDLIKGAQ